MIRRSLSVLNGARVSPSATANLFTSYLPQRCISAAEHQLIDSSSPCGILCFSPSSSSLFYSFFCLHSSGIHYSHKRRNCFYRKDSSFPFQPSCFSLLSLCENLLVSCFAFSLNTDLSLLCRRQACRVFAPELRVLVELDSRQLHYTSV